MKSYDFSDISVLVAEHNSYMRQTMRSILRTFNIGQIDEAATPEMAWDMFQHRQPDVTFADWAPGFDGMSLLKRIRRDPESTNRYAPVIVVTSLTDQEHVLTARDLGMTEFLAKPYSPKLIFLRLQIIAERPRSFIRAGEFFGPDRRRRAMDVEEDRRAEAEAAAAAEEAARSERDGAVANA